MSDVIEIVREWRACWETGGVPVTAACDDGAGLVAIAAVALLDDLLAEARALREQVGKQQHCPNCDSTEWFPGAACWHCGWEAGANSDARARLTRLTREAEAWRMVDSKIAQTSFAIREHPIVLADIINAARAHAAGSDKEAT